MYFCQLDQRNIYYGVCTYDLGTFWLSGDPVKVSKWCDVDDIALALNDVTRAILQCEAVKG